MTIIDGDNYTQLTFLNVIDVLRVGGEIVTSGNGDVVGPLTSTNMAIPRWNGGTGELLQDSGVLIDGNNDMSFTLVGGEVGIDWSTDLSQKYVDSSTSLVFLGNNDTDFSFMVWDENGTGNSTLGGDLLIEPGTVAIGMSVWDGVGTPTGAKVIELNTGSMLVTDSEDLKGLEYADDYSGAWSDHSLVTKIYTDSLQPTITGHTSVPGSTQISSAAIAITGNKFIIKDESGLAGLSNKITITTEGAQLIDGLAELEIVSPYGVARLYSNGTNLFGY